MTTRRQFLGSSGSLALLALTGLPAFAQAAESTVRFAIAKALDMGIVGPKTTIQTAPGKLTP